MKSFFRAIKFLIKESPAIFPVALIYSVMEALYPYIGILLSAKILSELASPAREMEHILVFVFLLVALNFIGALIRNFFAQFFDVLRYIVMKKLEQSIAEKAWQMDYAMLSDTKINGKRQLIGSWIYGRGVIIVVNQMTNILFSLFTIGISVTLVIEFFMAKATVEGKIGSFLNHWMFAVVFLLCFFITMVYKLYTSAQIEKHSYEINEKLDEPFRQSDALMWSCGAEYQKGKDIRLFGGQSILYERLKTANDKVVALREKEEKFIRKRTVIGMILSKWFELVVYFFVSMKAMFGAFGVGSLLKYTGMVTQLGMGIQSLFFTILDIVENASYIEDYFEYMNLPNATTSGTLPIGKEIIENYEFEIRNVTFTYPNAKTPSLENVNCKFRKGEKTAIVGKNGSGKTTFIKLLCRLYDPQQGEILLNGVDIRKYRYDDYLHFFSTVFQDYRIFAFQLGENVAIEDEPNKEKVESVLEQAGFGERLSTLPKGIKTNLLKRIYDDGVELSGGEGQKVAIARCLYKDAPFAILDEPTAALDPISEADIYKRMNQFVQEKSAIYISHRLSSCHFCHRILVFEKGSIVEQGTHDELLSASGLYQKMWNAQAKYYV